MSQEILDLSDRVLRLEGKTVGRGLGFGTRGMRVVTDLRLTFDDGTRLLVSPGAEDNTITLEIKEPS